MTESNGGFSLWNKLPEEAAFRPGQPATSKPRDSAVQGKNRIQTALPPGYQWRKWRMPVKTMERPRRFGGGARVVVLHRAGGRQIPKRVCSHYFRVAK